MANHTRHWLTLKRLRAHGAIVALCLWSLYLWTIATPGLRDRNGNLKGTDFLHLYTLGSLAAAHRGADLYDINAQAALAARACLKPPAFATCPCILRRFRFSSRRWLISRMAGL
jgi:hypothetical protein